MFRDMKCQYQVVKACPEALFGNGNEEKDILSPIFAQHGMTNATPSWHTQA